MLNEKFKYQLKETLALPLPGESSFLKMIPPGRQLKVKPEQEHLVKRSSVLIILYPQNKKLFCILIKRPGTMKFHAGQIAFPGGMIEKYDQSPLSAALREAQEEVGINPETIEIIGGITNLYISVSEFLISPFIGWCESEPVLNQNFFEVDKIIRFPVTDFLTDYKPTHAEMETFSGILDVPCFRFEEEIIWGATAMILSELFDILKKCDRCENSFP